MMNLGQGRVQTDSQELQCNTVQVQCNPPVAADWAGLTGPGGVAGCRMVDLGQGRVQFDAQELQCNAAVQRSNVLQCSACYSAVRCSAERCSAGTDP
jgi:hypothetical protein